MFKAYKIVVHGKVQRVGYRRYVLDLAQELGLAGYVENMKDGSVNIFVQGDQEKLVKFIDEAKAPSEPAKIKEFVQDEVSIEPDLRYFELKPGELWEELNEGLGAMQNIFMSYWGEFREFAVRTDENFKILMDRYGEISEKLTTILETLIRESKETREMINENIKLLKQAIEKLSEK